jgi:hypothetical protein
VTLGPDAYVGRRRRRQIGGVQAAFAVKASATTGARRSSEGAATDDAPRTGGTSLPGSYNLGSTGSLSNARTPKTHSCTRRSGSLRKRYEVTARIATGDVLRVLSDPQRLRPQGVLSVADTWNLRQIIESAPAHVFEMRYLG